MSSSQALKLSSSQALKLSTSPSLSLSLVLISGCMFLAGWRSLLDGIVFGIVFVVRLILDALFALVFCCDPIYAVQNRLLSLLRLCQEHCQYVTWQIKSSAHQKVIVLPSIGWSDLIRADRIWTDLIRFYQISKIYQTISNLVRSYILMRSYQIFANLLRPHEISSVWII